MHLLFQVVYSKHQKIITNLLFKSDFYFFLLRNDPMAEEFNFHTASSISSAKMIIIS